MAVANDVEVVDAVVIGAGVVGLACARVLARGGCETIVIERETAIGMHQSSRNSEVIHAGIYYPPGSLKARLCLEGKRRLYRYCAAREVPHRRCTKLIVATTPADVDVLQRLVDNARASGLSDLTMLRGAEARALEPELHCHRALLSPSTGIVDSHALLSSLRADAETHGAALALGTEVTALRSGDGHRLHVHTVDRQGQTHSVLARRVVNAAGFGAQTIARATTLDGGSPPCPALFLTKGTYFTVADKPFSRLIYPVPDTASLGIHVTVDMAGHVRFGPDQQWVDDVDYSLDPDRASAFEASIRRYFPGLRPGALQPAYVGVRSKVQAPGEGMADFVIDGPESHGTPGLVNLFGLESPGLTASLAIANEVANRLDIVPPQESS